MLELNKIYCGDSVDVMQGIDRDSIDCVVTDPPYQLSSPNIKNATKGFMGKSWDICPSIEIWQECLRVLKPGAFAFVMCIPRQDCLARMICRLEDAGFNISFSRVLHTFASGFPKAQNLSKTADKRAGVKRDVVAYDKVAAAHANKNKFNQCTAITPGNIGVNTHEFSAHTGEITEAATEQAKALDGAYGGFQPKTAVEVIIVAMKPIEETTYLDQALKNGHGCTWLDDCRIPFESERDIAPRHKNNTFKLKANDERGHTQMDGWGLNSEKREVACYNTGGRFPANVLCSDSVLDNGKTTKSTGGTGTRSKTDVFKGSEGREHFNYGDSGSFSRYFSLDAWFAERIKQLPKEAQKTFPWLIVPKASKSENNRGCKTLEGTVRFGSENKTGAMLPSKKIESHKIKGNYHPTCKPLKLMSWLITLASREGDTVLDPFCGSGTTAIAAKMLGRQYIGIEKEEEYCEIARKRISAIPTQLDSYNML